jgi:Ca-activated chloride channel homolog
MLTVAWPWMLAAGLLPLAVMRWCPRAPASPGAAVRVPFFREARSWSAREASVRGRDRLAIAVLAWLLLVGAACRPQWVGPPVDLPVTGRDLFLAVDLSGSMRVRDLVLDGRPANRLQVVQRVAGEFIDRRRGDRVGLLLFGTRAYLQAPLTQDLATVRGLLDEVTIGLPGEQTAIGDAIGLSVKHLRERPGDSRVLVLLTDGANTAGVADPLEAAAMAARERIRIYAIGVGAPPGELPNLPGMQAAGRGSELDEPVLEAIAERTGGHYFRARNTAELESIYAHIDELEPLAGEGELVRPVRELFHWPLGAAVLVVLAGCLAGLRGTPLDPRRGPEAGTADA